LGKGKEEKARPKGHFEAGGYERAAAEAGYNTMVGNAAPVSAVSRKIRQLKKEKGKENIDQPRLSSETRRKGEEEIDARESSVSLRLRSYGPSEKTIQFN